MSLTKLAIGLFTCAFLTACGGGSSAPAPTTSTNDVSTEEITQQIASTEQELSTLGTELVTPLADSNAVNLTGTWINMWAATTNFNLSYLEQSTAGNGSHEGFVILHIVDNGPTLTLNYCDTPESTWTLEFLNETQIRSPTDTDNLYLGVIENSSVITFPTAPYAASSTNQNGYTLAEQGYSAEVLIKLSDAVDDEVGFINDSEALGPENIRCARYGSRNFISPDFGGADRYLNYEGDTLSANWALDDNTQIWRDENEIAVQVGDRVYRLGLY